MIDKPGFVMLLTALVTIHLERLLPVASSNLPGHDAGSHLNGMPFLCPYVVLLRMGFTMPVLLPVRRCALTAPFHPYHGLPWRYFFCGTFPRVAPAGCYPASWSCGARTFLSPAFFKCLAAVTWPSDRKRTIMLVSGVGQGWCHF